MLTLNDREFIPQDPHRVTMWVCGPTVYSKPHIGNLRSAVNFDVLFRVLRRLYGSENVVFARNYTDIDDKIIAKAAERGVSTSEITLEAGRAYQKSTRALHVLDPTYAPLATSHVHDMWTMIEDLMAKGHAYEVEGEIFFHVPSNPHPGLVNQNELEGQHRIEPDPRKRDPRDFVLWKPIKPGEPERWYHDSYGWGRPGWHIECSAMIKAMLGMTIDIHGGGIDLRFPHHECEMAQSHCSNGQPLANYWLHNGMLVMDKKMSKSAGNMVYLDELLEDVSPEAVRYFFLTAQYHQPLSFTIAQMKAAQVAMEGLKRSLRLVKGEPVSDYLGPLLDDLATPRALAELHHLSSLVMTDRAEPQQISNFASLADVLGLREGLDVEVTSEALDIQKSRDAARARCDFQEADRLRDQLIEMGLEVNDAPLTSN